MTTLKKLKLNALSQSELEKRSMSEIVGGYNCSCGCLGTSSTEDNKNANIKGEQTTQGILNVIAGWNLLQLLGNRYSMQVRMVANGIIRFVLLKLIVKYWKAKLILQN